MTKRASSFSLSPENIAYIDDQWPSKGKRNRSHWLDDLITHLREKAEAEKPRQKSRRFTPPTLDEAANYFKERGCLVESEVEKFMDFYEMKGWMVGKNKMKDWKAAVRNWLKGKGNEANQQQTNAISHSAASRVNSALEKQRAEFYSSPEALGDYDGIPNGQVGEEERGSAFIDLDQRDWSAK